METKIRLTIMNGAVDWVENGGERDLGFEVSLETVSDKDENNETKIYITGIEVKMAAEIGTDTEEKLLNEDESEDVNSKEKAGDLKRQEKTA
jgi:hypothetical protein